MRKEEELYYNKTFNKVKLAGIIVIFSETDSYQANEE